MVRYNGLVWSNIAVTLFYHPIYMIIGPGNVVVNMNYETSLPAVRILLRTVVSASTIAKIVIIKYLIAVVITAPLHWEVTTVHRVDTLTTLQSIASSSSVNSMFISYPASSSFAPEPSQ